jgi:hypothetical protein
MSDLWPKDIGQTALRAPVTILREQASLLGEKTQNLVKADVDTLSPHSPYNQFGAEFVHRFYLIAPALDDYRYKLFEITHPVDLYPVNFHLDEDIQEELLAKNGKEPLSAQTEDELTNILGKILNSEKAKHVVRALLAQHPSFEPAEALSV